MGRYMPELREILEDYATVTGLKGNAKINEIIELTRPVIFDFDYPIFDEKYRVVLETKIMKHYYTRELGSETVALFRHFLDRKMNEIMPYYNQLYKSTLLEFNPFYDVDLTREHNVSSKGKKEDNGKSTSVTENSATNTNSNKSTNLYSDTPQGGVNNLADMSYLTNATLDNDEGRNTSNSNGKNSVDSKVEVVTNNTEDYLERVKGKSGGGSYATLLKEYRATFLNLDMQVIEELNSLFMGVW